MSNFMINTTTLPDLSVTQIAELSQQQLQEFDLSLNLLATWVKQSRDRLNAALDQRYADQSAAIRRESGKDFGVCHLTDGPLRVTVELPKRVAWDQEQLASIATRIAAAGENISDFIDVDYSVSESRFNNWPPALKEQFVSARTVKPGKTSYRLALIQENQE